MPGSQSVAGGKTGGGLLVLGVDTCGSSGSVALARIDLIPPLLRKDWAPEGPAGGRVEVLGETELAGRTYSATLVSAVEGLLSVQGVKLGEIGAIVVVNGPGSFTGVRVGLSAVKGLAEPGGIPVVAVSRLEVLAAKAGVGSAALDAHRHEVFLRMTDAGGVRELLAGAEELAQLAHGTSGSDVSRVSESRPGTPVRSDLNVSHISKAKCGAPRLIAVCEDTAAGLVGAARSGVKLIRVEVPTAGDAIRLCVPAILAGEFADLASLDGHYLRRSDAEIFGDKAKAAAKRPEVRLRRMETGDIDAVMEIVEKTDQAPRWGRQAYEASLDPESRPERVALVAEDGQGGLAGFAVATLLPGAEAELESIVTAVPHQRRGVARELFGVLKAELRRRGANELVLEVREGNRAALGFYRFLGFREEGRRPGYYTNPVEDAVLMRVKLR